MATSPGINTELDGIGHVLRDKELSVPKYQRSYAWEERHVQELIEDIEQAIKDNEQQYFLGSVITTNAGSGRPDVVDGQQRLATVTILLAAIRDYFDVNGDSDRANQINGYLVKSNLRTRIDEPKLQLNDRDSEFFAKRILSRNPDERREAEGIRDSHRKIAAAAEKAKEYIARLVRRPGDPADVLIDRVEYIEERVQIIFVQVPDDSNAFAIFETLNDRGLELALSDLLKNYLFSKAGDRLDQVREPWIGMFHLFEANGNEDNVVDFIRQHWSSRYGLTRKKELYDKIKAAVRSPQRAVEVANELSASARYYQALVNTESPMWAKYDGTAKVRMQVLNEIGIVSQRPLLLAILAKFAPAEVKKAMRLIVSWTVRFMIVGRLNVTALEENYSQRAKDIFDGKIKMASQLRTAMVIAPSDTEFQKAFERASVSKNKLARYYLRALEVIASKGAGSELVVNPNADEVNLEHILPESPHANWPGVTAEQAATYTHRIGNLALMGAQPNRDAGNLPFADKKALYKDSKLKLTKSLTKFTAWGPDQIEGRQKQLAELAVKAWPLTI